MPKALNKIPKALNIKPKADFYIYSMSPMGHRTNQYVQYIMEAMGVFQLLFGVLRILRTLMEWNRTRSHDCSELFWLHQL